MRASAPSGLKLDGSPHTFALSNSYATDRVGWRELLVAKADGVAVRSTDASVGDRTRALTHYPTDLLHSPPDVRSETTVAALGSGGLSVQAIPANDEYAPAEASDSAKSDGGFVSLIENGGSLSVWGAILALGLALVFGMVHALTPGHGKTMVAAYLAGTRGQARHALILGATVTVTHTAGVFALGIVTLSLSQFIVPEQLYPWLNLASGVMVVGIGAFAIRDRLRRWLRAARPRAAATHDHGHEHAHDHGHDTRTTTATITGTAIPTRRPTSCRCARSSPSASRAACCRVPRRSSCCSRRSRCTAWPSAWR